MIDAKRISEIRKQFPILQTHVRGYPLVYFDNASTTQKPLSVIESISEYYKCYNANTGRGIYSLSSRSSEILENSRKKVAKFINASESEVVFSGGVTDGINMVARSFIAGQLSAGNKIMCTQMDHHSNILPWNNLCKEKGAELIAAPITPEGDIDIEWIEKTLKSGGVKLLVLPHISNSIGTINDIRTVCSIARKYGVLTLVDAAQSSGEMTIDVKEAFCDFLVFSSHKMYGPMGVGVVYARHEHVSKAIPFRYGGGIVSSVS